MRGSRPRSLPRRVRLPMLARLGARVTEDTCAFDNPDVVWRVLQQSNWAARFAALKPEDRGKLSPTLNAGIDAGLSYRGLELQRALVKRSELFRAVQGVFGKGIDFILTPCVSAPPVAADHDLARRWSSMASKPATCARSGRPISRCSTSLATPRLRCRRALRNRALRSACSSWRPGPRTRHCSRRPTPTSARARRRGSCGYRCSASPDAAHCRVG